MSMGFNQGQGLALGAWTPLVNNPSGGSVASLTDHLDGVLYSADNTFPRSFPAATDAQLGLTWFKNRTTGGTGTNNTHRLLVPTDLITPAYDHCPLTNNNPASNTTITVAETSVSLDSNAAPASYVNTQSPDNYIMWLFKNLAGFMNVTTYTGNATNRTIAHGLGIAPGFMLTKDTSTVETWYAWHKDMTSSAYYYSFATGNAETLGATLWNSTAPDASVFSVGTSSLTNRSGGAFTAFLFGHDTSATGRIQCGTYTGNANVAGPIVTLGWDPRYLLIKKRSLTGPWHIFDTFRTPGFTGNDALLTTQDGGETATTDYLSLTGTGFQIVSNGSSLNQSATPFLYVAIR